LLLKRILTFLSSLRMTLIQLEFKRGIDNIEVII
jgi:hypothetical protein